MKDILIADDDPDFVEIITDEYVPTRAWMTKPVRPETLIKAVKKLVS